MSSHIVSITFFIISICLVLNIDDLKINSYQEITIPEDSFNFTYQYKRPKISDSENVYFYFRMYDQDKDYYYYLTIKTEDGKEEEIYFTSSYFFGYYASELNDTKFFFEIKDAKNRKLLFIDSSQEININLDIFISLNFVTDYINNIPPKALIFNVDVTDFTQAQNKTIYFISEIDTFLNSDYLVSYCIEDEMNENECNYTQLKKLPIGEDTKYKIKLSAYKINEKRYKFGYFKVIKEVEFGIIQYDPIKNDDRFYLFNAKDFSTFHIYHNYEFDYRFIEESEKNNLPDNIDSLTFEDSWNNNGVEEMKVIYDSNYLIIKIHPYSDRNKIIFYLFEEYIDLTSDS